MKKFGLLSLVLALALVGCKRAAESTAPSATDHAATDHAATAEPATGGETHEAPTTEGSAEATP